MSSKEKPGRSLELAAAGLCGALFLLHFFYVVAYSVDFPWDDEWKMFHPDALPSGLSLRWLFSFHNEHRIVFTRLIIWALYKLDGWNLIVHQTFNFLLYGGLLLMVFEFARTRVPRLPPWVVLGFLALLLSPISHDNHKLAFNTHFHLVLVFHLLMVMVLYRREQGWGRIFGGLALGLACLCSFSSGLALSAVNLAVFAAFKAARAGAAPRARRARELAQFAAFALPTLVAMRLWFVGYVKNAANPDMALPTSRLFWDAFLNSVSYSFGFETLSWVLGALCFVLVAAPAAGLLARRWRELSPETWAVLAVLGGTLATIASIAAGRGGFGVPQVKGSRYFELGMLVVPFGAFAWALLLEKKRVLRAAAVGAVWLVCFVGLANKWRFPVYMDDLWEKLLWRDCVKHWLVKGDPGASCPKYIDPIKPDFLVARQIHVSFTDKVMAEIAAESHH